MENNRHMAAYVLSDEIYAALRSTQLSHHLLNEIFENRVEDSEADHMTTFELRLRLSDIAWRLEIVTDYVAETEGILARLDRLTQAEDVDRSCNTKGAKTDEKTKELIDNLQRLTTKQKESIIGVLRDLASGRDPDWPQEYLDWKAAKEGFAEVESANDIPPYKEAQHEV